LKCFSDVDTEYRNQEREIFEVLRMMFIELEEVFNAFPEEE
jgi:hypothetical protein